jgi:hypothetical protein
MSYWALETNTPFYGWGLAGRIETTALAVEAISRSNRLQGRDRTLVDRGLLFLLRQKDRYGVWLSTQATINVLDALLTRLSNREAGGASDKADVLVNGRLVKTVTMAEGNGSISPIAIDLSGHLAAGDNRVEIRRAHGARQATAQLVSTHFAPWSSSSTSGAKGSLRLRVGYDKAEARIGDEITCSVEAERVGFRGYGMMLGEIGLPPGADVDRASLDAAVKGADWGLVGYDVLPDRLIVYLWPRAGGTRFNFKFRTRFALRAESGPTMLYDYYNPEARAVLAPTRFVVR